MPEYRIFKLDRGGHINAPATFIVHDDDDEAIKHAKQLVDGHDVELWQGIRLVITLESSDKK